MGKYIWNVLEAVSQLGNAVLLNGNPNMTISARSYLNRKKRGWALAYRTINTVFFWQEDHCRESWVNDVWFARSALFELEIPKRN